MGSEVVCKSVLSWCLDRAKHKKHLSETNINWEHAYAFTLPEEGKEGQEDAFFASACSFLLLLSIAAFTALLLPRFVPRKDRSPTHIFHNQ